MLLNRVTPRTITTSLLLLRGSNGNSHTEIAIIQKKKFRKWPLREMVDFLTTR